MSFVKDKYQEFLESKICLSAGSGLDCDASGVNPILKPHQRDIVLWAIRGGKRAIFTRFGLGKTMIQLETLRLILKQSGGGQALIVMPLGVRQEFKRDAAKLGTQVSFIRSDEELRQQSLNGAPPEIYLTNYESVREGKLDPRQFKALSLDEAGILRGFGGTKTFREFMRMFEGTSTYRFVATATPSPNEFIELLAYAAFLDIMDVGQAKTRFFKRDSTHADRLTLHPHKEKEFWLWVASWAIFLQKPSDLGYSDEGYEMPPLEIRWHEISTDHKNAGHERDGQGKLLRNSAIGVRDASAEKRRSLDDRIEKMSEIIHAEPSEHFLLWHDLEAERHAIKAAIPEAAEVYGSQDLEIREQNVIDFTEGRIQYLASKPVLSGSGCNFQYHCHRAIFTGIGFKFNDFIQAIHRLHRFLQDKTVGIDIIYTEAERQVRRQLERKWADHDKLVAHMTRIIQEYGLTSAAMTQALKRTIGVERREAGGKSWRLVLNDAIEEAPRIDSDSIGLIVTSIPFSTQYEYSPSLNDLGHNEDNARFWEQMDFLTPELLRVLEPGRVAAIHVKDRICPGGVSGLGFQTLQPFHAEAIFHYQKHGFAFLGMKTIITDVVRENNQTYRLGWTEQCKDGSRMGCGVPEYLLIFRKPPTDRTNGYADNPILKEKPLCDDNGPAAPFDSRTNWRRPIPGTGYSRALWQLDAHGFTRSSGDRLLSSAELKSLPHEKLYKLWRDRSLEKVYDFKEHLVVTEELDYMERLPATFMLLPPHSWHPDVWTDVARMRTLNGTQQAKGREMHLCPLQFDIVERLIVQFSMPGEIVLDPFCGLGTVPMMAIKLGRRGLGIELSETYWRDAIIYCTEAEQHHEIPSLFDAIGEEGADVMEAP